VVGNHRQIQVDTAHLGVVAVEGGDIPHVFIGMTAAKAGEIHEDIADMGNLQVEDGGDFFAQIEELAAIAGDKAGLGAVHRHIAAQPGGEEFHGGVNRAHLKAQLVLALQLAEGDLPRTNRVAALGVGKFRHRYAVHLRQLFHVPEAGLPAFGAEG